MLEGRKTRWGETEVARRMENKRGGGMEVELVKGMNEEC
jgi:hypothetical protein